MIDLDELLELPGIRPIAAGRLAQAIENYHLSDPMVEYIPLSSLPTVRRKRVDTQRPKKPVTTRPAAPPKPPAKPPAGPPENRCLKTDPFPAWQGAVEIVRAASPADVK